MWFKNKEKMLRMSKNVSLILLGSFLLALADALFIMPCNIINGGIDSLGVIINFFFKDKVGFDLSDIVIAVFQVLLWVLGLLLLGKKFSFYTLLGTLAFPAFYSLLLRIDFISLVKIDTFYTSHLDSNGNIDFITLIISGIFGGLLTGAGVAITFLGDGSTGGTDILSFIIAKYTSIKQDLSGLILDSTMIIIGLICLQSYELALTGILSAIVASFIIRKIYIEADNPVTMDIISNNPQPIMDFIHNKLDHATTLVQVEGGYSKKKRVAVKAVVYGSEARDVKAFVSTVDPDAFITSTSAENVSGEGFEPLRFSPRSLKRILHRYGIKTKNSYKNTK